MKLYIKYDEDGLPLAIGDSMADLARQIGETRYAIYHGLTRGSPLYAVVDIPDDDDNYEDLAKNNAP